MAEPSIREALEASFKDAGEPPAGEPAEPAVAPQGGEPTEPPAGDNAASDGGVPSVPDNAVGKPAEPKQYLDQQGKPGEQPAVPAEPAKPASEPVSTARAPTSWHPELRDAFKTLPEPVQREILRREADVQRFVQETAGYRKYVEDFERVCAPYQQLIALEGDPLKAFGDYLKTASLLRIGTPTEKARAIASAVKQFNVDVGTLDSALAAVFNGQPMSPSPNGANGGAQYQDPRVDQLLGALAQSRERRNQEMEERQLAAIQEFRDDPKNEFFEDLRQEIADLLDFNANRGVKMTIQQAYEMAAQMHPQIGKIYLQKKAQEQATANQAIMAQKRRAAVGVPGAPDVGTAPKQNDTIRGALEAAFNQHQSPV